MLTVDIRPTILFTSISLCIILDKLLNSIGLMNNPSKESNGSSLSFRVNILKQTTNSNGDAIIGVPVQNSI